MPRSVGFADFEFELMARSVQELEQLTKPLIDRFAASIREYDYFAFTKVHKV